MFIAVDSSALTGIGTLVAVGVGGAVVGAVVGFVAGRLSDGMPVRRSPGVGDGGDDDDGDLVEIYVGNLSYDMSEDEMYREFKKFGKVKSARIIQNRFNGKSKGFGFVEMPVRSEAEKAIKAIHNRDIKGRKLRVNEARSKSRDD